MEATSNELDDSKFNLSLVCEILKEYNLKADALDLDLYLKAYKELKR